MTWRGLPAVLLGVVVVSAMAFAPVNVRFAHRRARAILSASNKGTQAPSNNHPLPIVKREGIDARKKSTVLIREQVEVKDEPKAISAFELDQSVTEASQPNVLFYKALLLGVAVVWGGGFVAVKFLDSAGIDVAVLMAIRFFLASLTLLPFMWKQSWDVIKGGLEVGLWVTLGYVTQAIGMQTTDASKSAFICSLTVLVVPLFNGIFQRRTISSSTWAACLLAVVGVGLLTLQGSGAGLVVGDLWSLGQPLGFGIAFSRIEHYMSTVAKGKALALSGAQMVSVFLCSLLWAGYTTSGFTVFPAHLDVLADAPHLAALLYTGIVTSALAVVAESFALAYVPAEETAVIFSTEPLWAAVTSAVVLGERLKPAGYAGGMAILVACLLTQIDLTSISALFTVAASSSPVASLLEETVGQSNNLE